ncbi:hypothetical protein FRC14_000123 [Serendipita sp. 396]|nr:hypothetical protein FRC14_000123 [Serendipita sp. 396]KAG8789132.1 hypothetical protein FRC15_011700 [Serendipita sp. 397]KAG8804175.1 hypothetical protein FRC16_000115 [Serendipita sp. 398]KAG8877276.1 hypothetical protein FRC20_011642 [Serendipita sp. 405]
MQYSRNTPTPQPLSGQQLTENDLNEYRQLFEQARRHRPISPTLPPSPPISSGGDTAPSSVPSENLGKRQPVGTLSGDSASTHKQQILKDFIPPSRKRHGPHKNMREIEEIHKNRATKYKRSTDKDVQIASSAFGAHYYGISILNYAFAYCHQRSAQWNSLNVMIKMTIDRFTKLATRDPSPKLDVWLSYLAYFQYAFEIQSDREQMARLRDIIDRQLHRPQSFLTATLSSGQPSTPASGSTDLIKVNDEKATTPQPRHPNQPGTEANNTSQQEEATLTLKWDDAENLRDVLSRARKGAHSVAIRRRVFKNLNPISLREHFPRTFLRTFGNNGTGHSTVNGDVQSQNPPVDLTGPLDLWEDYEIRDLEENEKDGGDFPYPHQAEDIIWVIVLGRALLAELNLPHKFS